MLKKIFIILLCGATLGCGKFVPRRDTSQIIKNVDINQNTIIIYKLNMNKNFYAELDKLANKINATKSINLILPKNAYNKILKMKNGEMNDKKEKIFTKEAYLLTRAEKNFIDKDIYGEYDGNTTQKYLNKQVEFWCKKNNIEFNPTKDYTELDKSKLIDNIINKQKKLGINLSKIFPNCAVNSDFNTSLPLYLKTNNLNDLDFNNIKSRIIIINGNVKDKVIKDKILLITNKNVSNIRGHQIFAKIIEVSTPLFLLDKLKEKGLFLKNLNNFKVKRDDYTLPQAKIIHKLKVDNKLNLMDKEHSWEMENKK